ncbi:MAG: hypothetical protein WC787_04130 [Patescibacteria group bacterium]|jgi:hypothetical protein
MSLSVPSKVIEMVKSGERISSPVFIKLVQASLPAFNVVCSFLAAQLTESNPRASQSMTGVLGEHYGQVLRGMASTAIRREMQKHFGCTFYMKAERTLSAVLPEHEPEEMDDVDPEHLKEDLAQGYSTLQVIHRRVSDGSDFAVFAPKTMSDKRRLELLTLMAVEPYKRSLEKAMNMEFAFQNCHKSSGKGKGTSPQAFDDFCTIEAQLLNQSADMTDC